jgi:hypothetical protein
METAKTAKQVLGFQKSFFDSSFNAMCVVQDQTETMVTGFMNQLPWMTADGKKAVASSLEFTKKLRGDIKKNIDDGYKNIDAFFEAK